jgi:hypothetical protein
VLRETIPFWVISAAVIVILTVANKLGYRSAAWLHLAGAQHVLWVDFVWLLANFGTFMIRFAIFHYVVFADRRRPAQEPIPGPARPTAPGPTGATASAQPPGQVAELGQGGAAGDFR